MASFDDIVRTLAPELKSMNGIIGSQLATSNPLLDEVVKNYLKTKGKQLRPIIVILSARMFGEVNEHVLHAGAALEMLHNASLIHDDVVDDTPLRRGYPTVNSIYGNHLAVLVGDYFVSNALAAGIRTGRASIISALSALGVELSLGEVEQICNARALSFSESDYLSMIGKKTASLFTGCVKMGAEAVDASPEAYQPLMEYVRLLGLCFQIKDDIFDYFDSGKIGKPTGNDLREGKVSLPLIYALRVAPAEESDRMKKLLALDSLDECQIHVLIDFAHRHGGIDYSFERMREMQREAEKIIAVYPESETRDCFSGIFDYIISRDR